MAQRVELRAKQKKKYFEDAMKGDHVLVHLDARKQSVQVPAHIADNPALTLKLSYLFQGKTTHDDQAISVYLKFSGDYHHCVVPWDAVWGMTASDQKSRIWTEDVPREVVVQLARAKMAEVGKRLFRRGKKEEQGEAVAPTAAAEKPKPQSSDKKSKKVAHLKRVK
jgi:hypothetical protein